MYYKQFICFCQGGLLFPPLFDLLVDLMESQKTVKDKVLYEIVLVKTF